MSPLGMPCLAQADLAHLSALEYDLAQRALVIGAIYALILTAGLVMDVVLLVSMRTRPWPWREGMSRLVWRPWGLSDSRVLLIVLALSFTGAALLRAPLSRLADPLGLSQASLLIVVQSVVFHWVGLACVVLMLSRRGLSWNSAFGFSGKGFLRAAGWGVVLLLAAMPLVLLYTLLYHLLLQALGHHPSLQEVAFAISDEHQVWMRVYFFALAVGIAPLFEEILFRGILLPVLSRRFGVAAAVIAVSALFAIIHGHVPSMVTLFLLSVALCTGYILTGSLTTAVIMHGLFNAVTVTILYTVK